MLSPRALRDSKYVQIYAGHLYHMKLTELERFVSVFSDKDEKNLFEELFPIEVEVSRISLEIFSAEIDFAVDFEDCKLISLYELSDLTHHCQCNVD